MLYTNPNFDYEEPIVFIDGKNDIPQKQERKKKKKKKEKEEEEEEIVVKKQKQEEPPPTPVQDEELLRAYELLTERVRSYVTPVHLFIGMLEAALGGRDKFNHYRWYLPVLKLDGITGVEDLYTKHSHLPDHIIQDVQDALDKPKNVGLPAIEIDYSIQTRESYVIYQTMLNFSTQGAIEMAVSDINLCAGKNFSASQLLNSATARSFFAQYVATKFQVARSQAVPLADQPGSTYFISPSFKQLTAQSKWLIGAKEWFRRVYVQPRDRELYLQKLGALIEEIRANRGNEAAKKRLRARLFKLKDEQMDELVFRN